MKNGKAPSISRTKDYRRLRTCEDNREIDLKKHKKLIESMKKYGFLPCFPVVCRRKGTQLVVRDGQHRVVIAESLDLPVYFVVTDVDFDIAEVNTTPKTWTLKDYAQTYARKGVESYVEALEFSEKHGLPMGTSVALLSGTTTFGNVQNAYISGRFAVKDRDWAHSVASLNASLNALSDEKHGARLTEALMAICRVEEFESQRLIDNGTKCRDRLVQYSTRDAYLGMLDDVYNFGRKRKVPLKFQAEEAMRKRNFAVSSGS